MTHINLSEWALRHRSMVAYLIVVLMVGGILSYFKLGRAEDPDFTVKVMVVRTLWPGATAQEVVHAACGGIAQARDFVAGQHVQPAAWIDARIHGRCASRIRVAGAAPPRTRRRSASTVRTRSRRRSLRR